LAYVAATHVVCSVAKAQQSAADATNCRLNETPLVTLVPGCVVQHDAKAGNNTKRSMAAFIVLEKEKRAKYKLVKSIRN
jgi:hypothetical protein